MEAAYEFAIRRGVDHFEARQFAIWVEADNIVNLTAAFEGWKAEL